MSTIEAQSVGGPSIAPTEQDGKTAPQTVANDILPDVGDTPDLTFPYVVVVMEMLYMFVKSSLDFFLVHGLARFIINLDEITILQNIVNIKFISCFFVIPFATVCDSYLGSYEYFLVIAGQCSLIAMPAFYFVMSAPAYMLPSNQKLYMHEICLLLHGLNFLMEPVRAILVIKSVMTRYQFPTKRTFFALLLFGWNFATLLAAGGIYVSRSSRIWYSILMIVNIAFLALYISFLLLFKKIFFQRRRPVYCCVEKVFANALCYSIKKIDQICCKKRTFKIPGWQDFRSFQFSARTSLNTHAFVGILIVMTPLTTFYVMDVFLEYYYYIQFPMLKYETEQLPTEGMKAAFYCVLSPVFEYILLPQMKKLIKAETGLELSLVGIGIFFCACALFWCSVVQHKLLNKMEFLSHNSGTGHLVLINALSAPVTVRGKYYNQFMSWKVNNWFELLPWVPLRILYIPRSEIPFNITVSCPTFSMYDFYELPLVEDQYNWYLIFPHGAVQLPVGTFYHKREVAMKPYLYTPATVNVLCRIPICAGYLTFKKNEQLSINTVIKSSQNMVTLEMVGKFLISFALVGNKSNAAVIEANFERLGVYLLVIHIEETINISRNWAVDNITPSTVIRTTITIVDNNTPRTQSIAYMYPTVVINALGEALAKVSIMSWLYFATPVDLRALCYSLPTFLSFPAYAYLGILGPMRFQVVVPVAIFSFACACCFFIVVFFFAALYHTHRWDKGKSALHVKPKKESFLGDRQKRESHLSERSKDV